jgi:hypothetical protein
MGRQCADERDGRSRTDLHETILRFARRCRSRLVSGRLVHRPKEGHVAMTMCRPLVLMILVASMERSVGAEQLVWTPSLADRQECGALPKSVHVSEIGYVANKRGDQIETLSIFKAEVPDARLVLAASVSSNVTAKGPQATKCLGVYGYHYKRSTTLQLGTANTAVQIRMNKMPARAEPVVVIAAHLGAVPIEMDADRAAPAATRAGIWVAIRREVEGVDGPGRNRRSSTRRQPGTGNVRSPAQRRLELV